MSNLKKDNQNKQNKGYETSAIIGGATGATTGLLVGNKIGKDINKNVDKLPFKNLKNNLKGKTKLIGLGLSVPLAYTGALTGMGINYYKNKLGNKGDTK